MSKVHWVACNAESRGKRNFFFFFFKKRLKKKAGEAAQRLCKLLSRSPAQFPTSPQATEQCSGEGKGIKRWWWGILYFTSPKSFYYRCLGIKQRQQGGTKTHYYFFLCSECKDKPLCCMDHRTGTNVHVKHHQLVCALVLVCNFLSSVALQNPQCGRKIPLAHAGVTLSLDNQDTRGLYCLGVQVFIREFNAANQVSVPLPDTQGHSGNSPI